jgi:hypothetical protein
MLKFAAEDFWKASEFLDQIKTDAYRADLSVPEERERFRKSVATLVRHCNDLDLPVSVKEMQKLTEMPVAEFGDRLSVHFERISSVIHSELSARLFFHVTPEESAFYDKKELFGTSVNNKFPSIQFDMVEAGNCYATGRGTACVFHLMRIMEVGVQEFGKKLGVPLAKEKNWQNILDEVNKAIKALPPKAAGTVEMSQAAANLYSVKLAWRNEVMHPNDTYTLEEAEDILRQVKLFMRQLATIL